MMTFTVCRTFSNLKNRATSKVKSTKVLKQFGLNTDTNMEDSQFTSKDEILKLQSTRCTTWVLYRRMLFSFLWISTAKFIVTFHD